MKVTWTEKILWLAGNRVAWRAGLEVVSPFRRLRGVAQALKIQASLWKNQSKRSNCGLFFWDADFPVESQPVKPA